ncbi:MAG: transporter [Pseudonocardiales bacterium]|nr:transporter [Pseudonocardiales bacterium]
MQGNIAARIDRLPLLGRHYGYAGITQLFWGLMIASDGIVALLYPFLWKPQGLISSFEFDVLLGTNIGAGILVGEYVGGFLSDRIGRKATLVAAAVTEGLFIWPIAYTHAFWWLLLWNFLFALGMGALLATNAVYLHEIAPPANRQKLALRTQVIAPLSSAMLAGVLGYYWMPDHFKLFIWTLSLAPLVILVPLGIFVLPESPRWLESKGRIAEADRTVSKWERSAVAKYGSIPDPEVGRHTVVQTKKVPIGEVFQGSYRRQTVLLLAVWFLGYSGLVYGFSSFFPTFAVEHVHWDSDQVFLYTRILPVPFVIIVFYLVASLGERFERKTWVLLSGTAFALVVSLVALFTGDLFLIIVTIVTHGLASFWLFTMYNYTSAAYPTRLRSVGTGWTDGIGHLGSLVGTSLLVGRLFDWTLDAGAWGWILYCAIPGALIPSALMWYFGSKQKGGILEELAP